MAIMFETTLKEYQTAVEKYLNGCFTDERPQKRLFEAMRYSLLAGGKRIRPVLVLEFCRICGGDWKKALPLAAAIEMIHTYSLIHDDLPCMDDDDLRRGKPSCHIAYGEATALLAGDGLLTHAFDTMHHAANLPAEQILKAAGCLSKAIGAYGMIGGQVMDMANEQSNSVTEERLKSTDALKTGALISAACEMGCILASASQQKVFAAKAYAANIGLAFQITDDILDRTSTTEELGKPVGSDEESAKATYVSLYGVEKAREISAELLNEAKKQLKNGGLDSDFLCDLADYILSRKH